MLEAQLGNRHDHRQHNGNWRRAKYKIKNSWPFFVWLAVAVVAFLLYQYNPSLGVITGTVNAKSVEIGAPDTMVLLSIDVKIGQKVSTGDVVAKLDTRAIDGEIAEAEALAVQALSEEDYVLRVHQSFANEVASAEADILTAKIEMGEAEAEHAVLDNELVRLNKLLENKLIDAASVAEIRARHAALSQAVKQYPNLIKSHETHLVEAKKRYEEAKEWLYPGKDFNFSQAMKERTSAQSNVLHATLNMLKAARETYVLRAPCDGTISRIAYRQGETVLEGEPIIRIAPETSDEVVVFLREIQARELKEGMRVYISSLISPEEITAVVANVAPDISALPVRLTRPGEDVDIEIRGRRVMLKIMEKNNLIPGEAVRVRVPAVSRWQNLFKAKRG